MTRLVVGLAGRRGSGKSTIAAELQRDFGFARVSFGDYVRGVAKERELPLELASLEALGRALIDELGWARFCRAVLTGTESSPRVVVDGIRHVGARTTMRNLVAPGRFAVAFVQIDEAVRKRRLAARARPGDAIHGGEMSDDLDQLHREAEIVVDGDRADAARRILSCADRWSGNEP
jgi:hypothetical protein